MRITFSVGLLCSFYFKHEHATSHVNLSANNRLVIWTGCRRCGHVHHCVHAFPDRGHRAGKEAATIQGVADALRDGARYEGVMRTATTMAAANLRECSQNARHNTFYTALEHKTLELYIPIRTQFPSV